MTTYYSSLYEAAPNRGQSTSIPRSPGVDHRAVPVTEVFTFAMPNVQLLANDVIKLLPAVPGGAKITRFSALVGTGNQGLDNSTGVVINLGWASQANGTGVVTGFGSGLRVATAGTAQSVTDTQVLAQTAANGTASVTTNLQAAGAQDELQLTVTTQATTAPTANTLTFLVEYIAP